VTIANNERKKIFVGNGAATAWPFSFKAFDESDVEVYITDASGHDLKLATGVGYRVTLNVGSDGGVVDYPFPITGTKLTAAEKISLTRNVPSTQEVDLVDQGPLFAEVIEEGLDRLTVVNQQQQEKLDRCLNIPITTEGINTALPTPIALHSFRWNAAGNGFETTLDPATAVDAAIAQRDLAIAARVGSEAARAGSESVLATMEADVNNVALAAVATIQADITASKDAAAGSATFALTAKTAAEAAAASTNQAAPKAVYATLVALQTAFPTGTTGVYLVAADGKWYYWSTSWIAGGTYQSTGIASKSISLDKTNFLTPGKNMFNKNTITSGYYMNETNGNLIANALSSISDYIPLTSGFQYVDNLGRSMAYFNENKTFISGLNYPAIPGRIYTPPANAAYMRVSMLNTSIATYQLELGITASIYEKYYNDLVYPKDLIVKLANLDKEVIDAITIDSVIGLANARTSWAVMGQTRINSQKNTTDGYITKVKLHSNGIATIKVKLWSPHPILDHNYVFNTEFSITTSAGEVEYTVPKTFVPKGSVIGVYGPVENDLGYVSGVGYSKTLAGDFIGDLNAEPTVSAYSICLSATISATSSEGLEIVSDQVSDLEDKTKASQRIITNQLFYERFLGTLPSIFTNPGNFVLTTGKLSSPVVVGYNAQFYYNEKTVLDNNVIYAECKLTNLSSNIGLGLNPQSTVAAGRLAEVDFINSKIVIRKAWNFQSSISDIAIETPLTFTPVLNRVYKLEFKKDTAQKGIFKVTDTLTGEYTAVSYTAVSSSVTLGNGWEGACIVAINGSFDVLSISMFNNQPTRPQLAIYGDSFIEGNTMIPNIDNRYCSKVKAALNGNCLIAGEGGAQATTLIDKPIDFQNYQSKYTLLAIGTNDSFALLADFKANLQILIDRVVALGGVPILQTIPRRIEGATDNLVFIQQANPWIKSLGYKYIDFATALSLNYDGETQNPALFLSDHTHPSIAGHLAMYNKILVDIPEVFLVI